MSNASLPRVGAAAEGETTDSRQLRAVEPMGQGRGRTRERLILGTVGIVAVFGVWELMIVLKVQPRLILPSPADVVDAFRSIFTSDTIGADLTTSGTEFIYGYLLAIGFGVIVGVPLGWYVRVGYLLDPLVNFFYAVPRVAISPLLIVWLGIGATSRVALVFLMAVFPILINTSGGIRTIDSNLVRAARCFGASDLQIFRTVALPASVPFILAGLRISVGMALIGVFVAELMGSQHGIGQVIINSGAQFQTAKVFAGLIIFAAAGVIFTAVIRLVEKRFASWRL